MSAIIRVRLPNGKVIQIPAIKGDPGVPGKDGHTPEKGLDYYTPDEKRELIAEIEQNVTGDIENALDAIIAIQESLIGGADA